MTPNIWGPSTHQLSISPRGRCASNLPLNQNRPPCPCLSAQTHSWSLLVDKLPPPAPKPSSPYQGTTRGIRNTQKTCLKCPFLGPTHSLIP